MSEVISKLQYLIYSVTALTSLRDLRLAERRDCLLHIERDIPFIEILKNGYLRPISPCEGLIAKLYLLYSQIS